MNHNNLRYTPNNLQRVFSAFSLAFILGACQTEQTAEGVTVHSELDTTALQEGASNGICEVNFRSGAVIPVEVICSDGLKLYVGGSKLGGWNGSISFIDRTSKGIKGLVIAEDYEHKWQTNYDTATYSFDQVAGYTLVPAQNSELEEDINDTVQALEITPNKICGLIKVTSDGDGQGEYIIFNTCPPSQD